MPDNPYLQKTFYTSQKKVEKSLESIEKTVNSLSSSVNTFTSSGNNHRITDYISSFETDLYIYSGFIKNSFTHTIKRYKDGIEEIAVGVTDLSTDWSNRLILTYV